MITFSRIEPKSTFEYSVHLDGRRIGLVRKQEAASYPYHPTGRWLAARGAFISKAYPTRARAAAELVERQGGRT